MAATVPARHLMPDPEADVGKHLEIAVDLALISVQRRDPHRLVMYADAALDVARQTKSGVIGRKLQGLQTHLASFLGDSHVRYLNERITSLTGDHAT